METIYKVCSYKYAKKRNNRSKYKDVYTAQWTEDSSMFTSKAKAVDKARWYAECVEFLMKDYTLFQKGLLDHYCDKNIVILTLDEHEGVISTSEYHHFMETEEGQIYDYSGDQFFQTL